MHEEYSVKRIGEFLSQNRIPEKLDLNEAVFISHLDNVAMLSHIAQEPYFVVRFFNHFQTIEIEIDDDNLYLLSDNDIYQSCQSFFNGITDGFKNNLYDKNDILIFTHPLKKAKLFVYMDNQLSDPPCLNFRRLGGNYQYHLSEDDF